MPSSRQTRQRLRSIQSTKQIMRAMQLVSASKLKRSQVKLVQARAVLGFLDGLLERVLAARQAEEATSAASRRRAAEGVEHPLCRARPEGQSALVIFSSDAGLCGSYNANLIQLAESYLRRPFDSAQGAVPSEIEGRRDSSRATQVIYVGKKGHRYFTRQGFAAADAYLDLAGRPDLAKAGAIARALMERFLAGQAASIHLVYSRFVSSTVSRPTILQWLPIQLPAPATEPKAGGLWPPAIGLRREALDYIFEPSPERVVEDLLPRWALAKFQLVMLEAFTSEHSARMIAMKNATDNAEELLKALTLLRNKIRQATITKELSEIVGTAEALK